MAFFLWCLSLVALLPLSLAFPSGAPAGACGHMTPGHRENQTIISPQVADSPYTISVSSNMYAPSGTLTVTITGESFRGILLQARLADDSVVGTFSDPPTNTQLLQCSNAGDSVTHSNSDSKSAGTAFTWQAPASDVGKVTFSATVLQEYEVFWVGLQSQEITASSDESGSTWITANLGLLVSFLAISFFASRQ